MFAWIISAVCIVYVTVSLLAPPCLQLRIDASVAMLSAPAAHDIVAAAASSIHVS